MTKGTEVAAGPLTAAPRLVIDARIGTADGVGPMHRLLGLSLVERLARAARRTGYGAIHVVSPVDDIARYRSLFAGTANVVVGEGGADGDNAVTVCVPGLVVGERGWLAAAAEIAVTHGETVALGAGVVIYGPGASWPAAASREARIAASPGPAPLRIESKADLAAAERHLTRALGKSTDGYLERNVERPLSRLISRRLAPTPITPNQMTVISAAVGLAAAPFFLFADPLWQTIGALIFLAHSILDGCDGELARLRYQESRWGGILDFWGDNVVHTAIFGCMALGWSRAIGAEWPLALGAAAVLGALGSASFVYWRVMRPKREEGPLYVSVARQQKSRLVSMLDSLTRRDFIYLVLALSLFGKAAWFLALAAIGAPIFFAMLLVVAAQESGSARSEAV